MTNPINITGYGDIDNVPQDAKAMADILSRQGSSFVLHCLSEKVGSHAVKFSFNENERRTFVSSLTKELKESLLERL